MATTTNYSWTTPDDTALVKDGAAAIRSLGTAIDTTVYNNSLLGGSLTLLSTTTLSGASTTISGISGSYTNLLCYISGMTNATGNGTFRVGLNGSTTGHTGINNYFFSGTTSAEGLNNTYIVPNQGITRTDANNSIILSIPEYSSTTKLKTFNMFGGFYSSNVAGYQGFTISGIYHTNTNAITSILFNNSGGNFSSGTVLVYGVK